MLSLCWAVVSPPSFRTIIDLIWGLTYQQLDTMRLDESGRVRSSGGLTSISRGMAL